MSREAIGSHGLTSDGHLRYRPIEPATSGSAARLPNPRCDRLARRVYAQRKRPPTDRHHGLPSVSLGSRGSLHDERERSRVRVDRASARIGSALLLSSLLISCASARELAIAEAKNSRFTCRERLELLVRRHRSMSSASCAHAELAAGTIPRREGGRSPTSQWHLESRALGTRRRPCGRQHRRNPLGRSARLRRWRSGLRLAGALARHLAPPEIDPAAKPRVDRRHDLDRCPPALPVNERGDLPQVAAKCPRSSRCRRPTERRLRLESE